MFKDMTVYIPTKGRAESQETLKWMPKSIKKITWLVVPKEDKKLHSYKRLIVLPKEVKGMGKIRQYIVDTTKTKKIVMLDDDLKFYIRKSKKDWHLRYSTKEDMLRMFRYINKKLDKYAHCGISGREWNNRMQALYTKSTRMSRIIAYRVDILKAENITFRMKLMEDFDVTLSLLKKGYPNICSYFFSQGQGTSNASGGCSSYRTPGLQTKSAYLLAKRHAPFVKVVEKETKAAWKNTFQGKRTDVRVYWKKAFESANKQQRLK